jgi:hypothetical protein
VSHVNLRLDLLYLSSSFLTKRLHSFAGLCLDHVLAKSELVRKSFIALVDELIRSNASDMISGGKMNHLEP